MSRGVFTYGEIPHSGELQVHFKLKFPRMRSNVNNHCFSCRSVTCGSTTPTNISSSSGPSSWVSMGANDRGEDLRVPHFAQQSGGSRRLRRDQHGSYRRFLEIRTLAWYFIVLRSYYEPCCCNIIYCFPLLALIACLLWSFACFDCFSLACFGFFRLLALPKQ